MLHAAEKGCRSDPYRCTAFAVHRHSAWLFVPKAVKPASCEFARPRARPVQCRRASRSSESDLPEQKTIRDETSANCFGGPEH
eukprot:3560022-Heterocapsa_arctica.AAC.1